MTRALAAIAIGCAIAAGPATGQTAGTTGDTTGGRTATGPATPLKPAETAPEAAVCAGDCCVIDNQLVCSPPPKVDPGTNPVVIVPEPDLSGWLKQHGTEGLDDYLRMRGGMLNG